MEIYHSEEEQLEAIKHWWKDNSASVIAGLVIGVALVIGYNLWKDHRQHQAEQAAGVYQQMMKALNAKQAESADKLADRIVHEHAKTIYSTFAQLTQAKIKTDAGDIAAARRILEGVLASAAEDKFKHLARIRLGQVMLDSNEAQAAWEMVEQVPVKDMGEFERDYQLLKGDIYSALNRRDEARSAYQAARRLGASSAFLEMKMDEFGSHQEPAGE